MTYDIHLLCGLIKLIVGCVFIQATVAGKKERGCSRVAESIHHPEATRVDSKQRTAQACSFVTWFISIRYCCRNATEIWLRPFFFIVIIISFPFFAFISASCAVPPYFFYFLWFRCLFHSGCGFHLLCSFCLCGYRKKI